MDGFPEELLPGVPLAALARVVIPSNRSRTYTWRTSRGVFGARLVASEANATNRPSALIDGL
jgi:hypothetical protein